LDDIIPRKNKKIKLRGKDTSSIFPTHWWSWCEWNPKVKLQSQEMEREREREREREKGVSIMA
jgi:hypothetical protein